MSGYGPHIGYQVAQEQLRDRLERAARERLAPRRRARWRLVTASLLRSLASALERGGHAADLPDHATSLLAERP